jgi:hypothetical protein
MNDLKVARLPDAGAYCLAKTECTPMNDRSARLADRIRDARQPRV